MHPAHRFAGIDIGIGRAVETPAFVAGLAHRGGYRQPFVEWPGQERSLPFGRAHFSSEGLVGLVCQAQPIAMAEQQALAPGRQHRGVGQTHQSTCAQHRGAQKEIAVAHHERNLPAAGCISQHVDAGAFERQFARVVADPHLEQVAEDEDGISRCLPQVSRQRVDRSRHRCAQVQVGDEIHLPPGRWRGVVEVGRKRPGRGTGRAACFHQPTTVALSMRTSSSGTSS